MKTTNDVDDKSNVTTTNAPLCCALCSNPIQNYEKHSECSSKNHVFCMKNGCDTKITAICLFNTDKNGGECQFCLAASNNTVTSIELELQRLYASIRENTPVDYHTFVRIKSLHAKLLTAASIKK